MTQASDRTIFVEDFPAGLNVGEGWEYLSMGDFVTDDGVATLASVGVSIAPPARNTRTNEPMFVKEGPAVLGHLKWLVNSTNTIEVESGPARFTFTAAASCFGTSEHPYGSAVEDADADIRLGSGTLNVIEQESGLVFDFWIGQTSIYPIYERLGYPGTSYESFTQVPDRIRREPGSVQKYSITVDPGANTVVWEVDGKVVASIDRIGPSAPHWAKVLDHGGEPADVTPRRLTYGLGLMTLLDGSLPPSTKALVNQGSDLVHPTEFQGGPALFGQGVQLDVQSIVIERA